MSVKRLNLDDGHIVTLMVGTNKHMLGLATQGKWPSLLFASDNLETAAHYYEGCTMELKVRLEHLKRMKYVRDEEERREEEAIRGCAYTYGFALMRVPAGATWYSFSSDYLSTHVISVWEIEVDLSAYMEDDEDD